MTSLKNIKCDFASAAIAIFGIAVVSAATSASTAATPDLEYRIKKPISRPGFLGKGEFHHRTPRLSLQWVSSSRKKREPGTVKMRLNGQAGKSIKYRLKGSIGRREYRLTYRGVGYGPGNLTAEMKTERGAVWSLKPNQKPIIDVRIKPVSRRKYNGIISVRAETLHDSEKFDSVEIPFLFSKKIRRR